MAGFPMCPDCRREYEDPGDRRFHAEPTCCPVCGPQLSMPVAEAVALLRQGAILAVKGLGGYHLACDATNEEAVVRLRGRKLREEKPFALMTAAPEELAPVTPEERVLLESPAHPIVLLPRLARQRSKTAASVAPGSLRLGIMLPYTPLHHLLCADFEGPLVMTSGNLSDEPIAFEDDEARVRLASVADASSRTTARSTAVARTRSCAAGSPCAARAVTSLLACRCPSPLTARSWRREPN